MMQLTQFLSMAQTHGTRHHQWRRYKKVFTLECFSLHLPSSGISTCQTKSSMAKFFLSLKPYRSTNYDLQNTAVALKRNRSLMYFCGNQLMAKVEVNQQVLDQTTTKGYIMQNHRTADCHVQQRVVWAVSMNTKHAYV